MGRPWVSCGLHLYLKHIQCLPHGAFNPVEDFLDLVIMQRVWWVQQYEAGAAHSDWGGE